jgi:hypothetical protein
MARVRQLTPRNWGCSLADCIAPINAWLGGWHGFFGIASVEEMQMMRKIDAHIRRRLRAIILRHWKRKRTIAKRLVALGVNPRGAEEDHVLLGMQEVEVPEVLDHRLLDRALKGEVKFLQRLVSGEPGGADPQPAARGLARGHLGRQQGLGEPFV